MNPALLQKGSNSFRTDSEIKDHEGDLPLRKRTLYQLSYRSTNYALYCFNTVKHSDMSEILLTIKICIEIT